MLALHVSDTHLGAMPGGLPFRFRDIFEAFKETIDIAIREHVDVYLHAGDFFDRAHPPPEAYIIAYKQLKRLRDSGIRVVIVAGQHDMPKRYSVSPLIFLAEAGVADVVIVNDIARYDIEISGKIYEFVLVPYGRRSSISAAKPQSSRSILVAHLLLKELGLPVYDASIHDIQSNFYYIALGDYHGIRILRHPSGTLAVYPGATEVLKRDEYSVDGKHVVLVDLSGDEARIQPIKLASVRPWIIGEYRSSIQAIEDVTRLAREMVAHNMKKPMVVVTIRSQITQAIYREFDRLVRQGLIEHYVVEGIDNEEKSQKLAKQVTQIPERLELRAALRSILKNDRLVDAVLELVQEPSDLSARKLVELLLNDEATLQALETLKAKRSVFPISTNSDTKSSEETRQLRLSKGLGLMSFVRRDRG